MIQLVTAGSLFGGLDALTKMAGIGKSTFQVANKAIDKEKLKRQEKGKFDVRGAGLLHRQGEKNGHGNEFQGHVRAVFAFVSPAVCQIFGNRRDGDNETLGESCNFLSLLFQL